MERILIGNPESPLFSFNSAAMEKCQCVLTSSMSGDQLSIDQFMPVVYDAAYISVNFIPKNSTGLRTADGKTFNVKRGGPYLDKLPYGTPIWYYNNDNLIGKFYSQRIVRTGKAKFDVLAVSAVGILDGQQHNGGIYTGQTFAAVAGDIIGDQFAFTCADDVAGISIVGWLPIGTRRSNLHQLLFACGVALYKDAGGEIVFRFPDTGTVKNIPDNRIFLGGNVDYQTPATKAEVTEHTFLTSPVDEEVTLYDNTDSETANHVFVTFRDAPVYDLAVTDTLTIEESGVNYAIVSGTGTLTGKKYSHITRVLSSDTGEDTAVEKAVSVTEATLVNVANSENVLKRVLSYYSSARIIRNDIVLEGELAGDQVSFNNPYNEAEQAFIASLDITASSFLRASCEMITGYFPSGGGNNYTEVEVLTGSGVWTAPKSGKIRVAVIQGGQGGHGGYDGIDGSTNQVNKAIGESISYLTVKNGTVVGVGGDGAEGGNAGKVFVISLEVTKGQQFAFSSGVGGIGGNRGKPGAEGTHSKFGSYTSENGVIPDGGYLDIINNVLYAQKGIHGQRGENGYLGAPDVNSRGGGDLGGYPSSGSFYVSGIYSAFTSGGGGQGGDAYGKQGGAGETVPDGKTNISCHGGTGATPVANPKSTKIGCGGDGGHGGGGGGTGGTMTVDVSGFLAVPVLSKGGSGGLGSKGSDGADGGIIIFM